MKKKVWGFIGLLVFFAPIARADLNYDPEPSIDKGALVYKDHCVLCHGVAGAGDGVLPSKIKDYPSTNLLAKPKATNLAEIKKVITHGGTLPGISGFMPPMGNSLSWTETESVASFILLLRENPKQAAELSVEGKTNADASSLKQGMEIFLGQCALCHGETGKGNGRLSKVINSPPPFDLTSSRKPDEYLQQIITNGGEFMGRSKHMPPWGNQLTPAQINSVILYIKTLRN